jgi:3-hydroxyisobutyrate dehydrogenase-like beta-hydroxyacid dehydrogenase
MGSALAGVWLAGGVRVVATASGRSERTHRLAERAGVELLPDLDAVVAAADAVVSVVPPGRAAAVSRDVAAAASRTRVTPLFADLNAIAPQTARTLGQDLAEAGLELVDGSISGPPPWKPGTRIYLSGERAPEVAELPLDGVERIVVGREVGAASAVKMSTASVYKGTSALLAQALLAAHANGVLEHVLADLHSGAPELVANVERRLASAASKSGRYVGEMREIAATQEAAGLTPALFEAMAEVYASFADTELARATPPEELPEGLSLARLLDRLR